jgi:hypothetical protein
MVPGNNTAAVMVGAYGGLGIHTTLISMRIFPKYFNQIVFLSVGVMDSGSFKGDDAVDELRKRTEQDLEKYVRLATAMSIPACARLAIGPDAVEEAETLCLKIRKEFPKAVFFAGKLLFEEELFYHRWLHNNTAFAIQKRLQWLGIPTMIVPARITRTTKAKDAC